MEVQATRVEVHRILGQGSFGNVVDATLHFASASGQP